MSTPLPSTLTRARVAGRGPRPGGDAVVDGQHRPGSLEDHPRHGADHHGLHQADHPRGVVHEPDVPVHDVRRAQQQAPQGRRPAGEVERVVDVDDVGPAYLPRHPHQQPRREDREGHAEAGLQAVPGPQPHRPHPRLDRAPRPDGVGAAEQRHLPAALHEPLRLGREDGLEPADVRQAVVGDVQHPAADAAGGPEGRTWRVCRPSERAGAVRNPRLDVRCGGAYHAPALRGVLGVEGPWPWLRRPRTLTSGPPTSPSTTSDPTTSPPTRTPRSSPPQKPPSARAGSSASLPVTGLVLVLVAVAALVIPAFRDQVELSLEPAAGALRRALLRPPPAPARRSCVTATGRHGRASASWWRATSPTPAADRLPGRVSPRRRARCTRAPARSGSPRARRAVRGRSLRCPGRALPVSVRLPALRPADLGHCRDGDDGR